MRSLQQQLLERPSIVKVEKEYIQTNQTTELRQEQTKNISLQNEINKLKSEISNLENINRQRQGYTIDDRNRINEEMSKNKQLEAQV